MNPLAKAVAAALLFWAGSCSAPEAAPRASAEQDRPAAEVEPASWAGEAEPVTGVSGDYGRLMEAVGNARFVLLGESTHGTEEYYRERARISERLVRERGFRAIAIEGDWSATWRVNLYVRGLGNDRNAAEALSGYKHFPQWMWPNTAFRDFIERLRAHNLTVPPERRVGIYGMDVYDLFEAADAVVGYLRPIDAAAAERVRKHYRCFASYRRDTHAYGEAARRASRACTDEAAAAVEEIGRIPKPEGLEAAERHFAAVRAAASVAAAEEYFRTVYAGSLAWNVRDQRMARNVEEFAEHVGRLGGGEGKVVVWSHNTHSGDARATFAADRGEINLGQLLRQRHGAAAFLVGFFTHSGEVYAAPAWDERGRVYTLRPALPGSYADVLRRGGSAYSLVLRGRPELARRIGEERLERAVGVIYVPAMERESHYFEARIGEQFDAIVFIDQTRAVTPL